jgi:hypothetical protein
MPAAGCCIVNNAVVILCREACSRTHAWAASAGRVDACARASCPPPQPAPCWIPSLPHLGWPMERHHSQARLLCSSLLLWRRCDMETTSSRARAKPCGLRTMWAGPARGSMAAVPRACSLRFRAFSSVRNEGESTALFVPADVSAVAARAQASATQSQCPGTFTQSCYREDF